MSKDTNKLRMNIHTTKVFEDILKAFTSGKKGICLEGGTYSSKTYSALQFIIWLAEECGNSIDINIVSETIPHLKGGAIRDWFKILNETDVTSPFYNQTDHIYRRRGWNGLITFLSADNQKALGMRRDVLFINEGDTIPWGTASQLISRTEMFTIIDWNPRSEFWAHDYYLKVANGLPTEYNYDYKVDPNWLYGHYTYKDALDVIPKDKVNEILSLGGKDPNYQQIYVLGLLGKIENLVHPYFEQCKDLPDGEVFYGLDFGFAQDPTVLIKNVVKGDNLYSHQVLYKKVPMTNDDIARELELLHIRHEPIFPDPSEPKSAEELRRKGFNIQETEKGKGSKAFGIKKVNQFNQFWTEESVDCIKEQRNYRYVTKREPSSGREYISDDTTHQWSHGLDARRYAVAGWKLVAHDFKVRSIFAKKSLWGTLSGR